VGAAGSRLIWSRLRLVRSVASLPSREVLSGQGHRRDAWAAPPRPDVAASRGHAPGKGAVVIVRKLALVTISRGANVQGHRATSGYVQRFSPRLEPTSPTSGDTGRRQATLGRCAPLTMGSQTDWGKPAGALQFHSGRRRLLACLVVSPRRRRRDAESGKGGY